MFQVCRPVEVIALYKSTYLMMYIHYGQIIVYIGNDFDGEDPNIRHYSADDYEFAFSLCIVALAVAIGTLFVLRETNAKNIVFSD